MITTRAPDGANKERNVIVRKGYNCHNHHIHDNHENNDNHHPQSPARPPAVILIEQQAALTGRPLSLSWGETIVYAEPSVLVSNLEIILQ